MSLALAGQRGANVEPFHEYYQATACDAVRAGDATLPGSRQAAVCVVGGGFDGVNTALGLADRGVPDVVVLEAQEIAFGASGSNGGFVFGGFSRGEETLLRELGPRRVRGHDRRGRRDSSTHFHLRD